MYIVDGQSAQMFQLSMDFAEFVKLKEKLNIVIQFFNV